MMEQMDCEASRDCKLMQKQLEKLTVEKLTLEIEALKLSMNDEEKILKRYQNQVINTFLNYNLGCDQQ